VEVKLVSSSVVWWTAGGEWWYRIAWCVRQRRYQVTG